VGQLGIQELDRSGFVKRLAGVMIWSNPVNPAGQLMTWATWARPDVFLFFLNVGFETH
jgi:hypothetical protein